MYEATFAIADSSAYTAPTEGTDCRIELWCNDHADLLYVVGSSVEPVLSRVRSDIGIEDCLRGDGETVVITSSCLKRHETSHIERYLESHDCLLLPPLRYEDGRKHCRILALDSENLTELYAALLEDGFDVEVLRKREVGVPARSSPLVSLEETLPELTARQREVLSLAVEAGYYEIPRETTSEQLAAELGISRRAVDDHLRRVERKVLSALRSSLY
ncbi:helix-turn-helix domain-containing protein [Natronococcus sp. A-GB7]|uniref:helix-turn-helix domain-containing protein n=1 Tax=Natronococcus sp. A-GB7 TaxID=3037649 RepID=UPI00241BF4F9|nr:helix-turn-helix domain-containing protein [Natronococcus sp. A-GB7]MDG5820990.1 helix-turn-helix domain-containing protein [Natronococcus sp. A-GB7]